MQQKHNIRISLVCMVTLLGTLLCSAETVNLNFFANGTKIHTEHVASGGTYTLTEYVSNSSMSEYVCRDYSFVGWKVGEPVVGDETPSMSTTVTPTHNVNIYAVFRKAVVNRYVRITTTDNLHAGTNYLIVCYYMYGGEPQYYALGNEESTYKYNDIDYYKVNAERLYPKNGVIVDPDASLVWTLGGSEGAWKWTNAAANKGLQITDNTKPAWYEILIDHQMLVAKNSATPCNITVANGIFSIAHTSNGWALRYVPDVITETDDYFITQETSVATSYPFYIYEKESEYTSYPDCAAWTVNLDALDGTISGKLPASRLDTLQEASANSGVTLPTAIVSESTCSDWSFAGWHIDEPVSGNATLPTLYTDAYEPIYNGVTLYATYKKDRYEKISSKSDIVAGEVYVIASTRNQAVSSSRLYSYFFSKEAITVSDDLITSEVGSNIEWTYDGTRFRASDGTYLSLDGSKSDYYYVSNSSSPFVLRKDGSYYYLVEGTYNSTPVFGQYNGSSDDFYIYKKITTYSSYPHCAPYTVTLHAGGGTFDGGGDMRTMTESTPGSGITLPTTVTPACGDEWTFYGWFEGEELPSTYDTCFVDFHAPGSVYYPKSADAHLYAIYKRETDKFLIIHGLKELASDDTYLITYYAKEAGDASGKVYDWLLSSEQYDANHLKGVKGVAPQNGAGYYMQTSDSAVMWTISGSNHDWAVQNLKNNQYFRAYSTGETKTQEEDNSTIIWDRGDGFALTIGCVENGSDYYDIWYNGTYYETIEEDYETEGGKKYYSPYCYVYRREKEYASYPHCDPFTVHFETCGGSAADGAMTEAAVYAGIELPEAYANSDCAKEGWTFAGWALAPVAEETDLQTFDLYPAHTIYHPGSSTDTLYAVYHLKSNHFKRIQTVSRLHTGVNYIITTSGNYALTNQPDSEVSPTAVTSQSVSPDGAQIITSDDASIEWLLLGSVGEYELYNVARKVYLDLSEPGEALLPKTAEDQFDITYTDAKAYSVRSCMSIAGNTGSKYLGYSSSNFKSVANGDRPTIYFYRQQSTYNSFPSCIVETDALKWETDETGSYVYVESYHLSGAPDLSGGLSDPELQEDGTYRVKYDPSALTPCSRARVEWNGTSTMLKIPYVVTADANSSTVLGGRDCAECDVYVMPGKSLTINADKEIHTLTVTDGAVLNVANGVTLTVNALVLFAEGDQSAPVVNLNNTGSIVLKHGELYHDRRMDESRYFWFSLPYDAKLKEISYSNLAANGKAPVYRQDYYLKYYNGAKRTADANAGTQASTYWTHVAAKGENYTLRAGQGYIIGIADQWGKTQDDGKQHAKRVIRFTMRPETATWLTQERNGGTKTTDVAPSAAIDSRNARYAGWNLIGNPFMHGYNTGAVGAESGLVNGAWKQELDAKGDWTGRYVEDDEAGDVPYLTLYDESKPYGENYSQVLAANYDMRPFEAVFVQISEGEQVSFASAMSVPAYAPAYRRMAERERPLYTGIVLSGEGRTDRAGIVLSDDFTPAYEIGADLAKEFNKGGLNLYTLNPENHELAFNGLADEDAVEAIPVGITFPKAGTYTFAFDDQQYDKFALDTLQLIDLVEQTTTNLLLTDYMFTAGAGTLNNRFQLLVRRAHHAPAVATKVGDTTDGQNSGWTKLIRDGQLFIRRDDTMYDATGRSVR